MRAALYARVSTEEQVEGYSIDAQKRAFREFCVQKGWTPVTEYVEEGRSAHTEDLSKRPVFKEAVEAALAHQLDVLVVHKIDRFSRKLKVTLEYFDRLHKAGIGFVSISEQMDFSTPAGQVFLAMVGAFSQFSSDNLSQETKKGWHERRAQGLYCGLMPFGATKGQDGVPIPDIQGRGVNGDLVRNYEGLLLAFEEAASGRTDRQIAQLLNERGYRTTGNHGPLPFTKNTVRGMLTNRFHLGEIPDGKGGWMKAAHESLIPTELWERAQEVRERNRRARLGVGAGRTVGSLSGVAHCAGCGGRIHIHGTIKGRQRVECYGRAQGNGCSQPSAFLDYLEAQLGAYLASFKIPEDYQERILHYYESFRRCYDDVAAAKARLQARLVRLKELYSWGDIGKHEYFAEKERVQGELKALDTGDDKAQELARLANFLQDVRQAWSVASNEDRNRLARALFDVVWIRDGRVIGVEPQPELAPFFRLTQEPSEELSNLVGKWRPRGDSNPRSPP